MRKVTMKKTSLDAYQSLNKASRRKTVFDMIRRRPSRGWTRQELSAALDWPINCVTGRVRELLDGGIVYEDGHRHNDITGTRCRVLKPVPRENIA